MNAVPAKIAGVEEIIMCTPHQKDGTPNPNIIAAAKVAGVDKNSSLWAVHRQWRLCHTVQNPYRRLIKS